MTHPSEDDLILHSFGESRRPRSIEAHLESCEACAALYQGLVATLDAVQPPDAPARDGSYPLDVWRRVRAGLLEQRGMDPQAGWRLARRPWLVLSAAATLIVIASAAGRMWPGASPEVPAPGTGRHIATDADRSRQAAIGEHLDRSERLLLDLLHAHGDSIDLSDQQTHAADLLGANRFLRDAAADAGDQLVAGVLDDLERSLLDVVHGPSTMTSEQLQEIRSRVDAVALLFKVRVLSDELRELSLSPEFRGHTL